MFCSIVPPYILEHLAQHGDETQREAARATLVATELHRQMRATAPRKPVLGTRKVFDCQASTKLNGAALVRDEGAKATADISVNEAYDGLGATHDLYLHEFQRESIDDKGLRLDAYVHYDKRYDNAFWDGSEMIFGDGDGVTFNRFTIAVDVIGHELTHGVVQYERDLVYHGQSGALNESLADVFGSMVKQRVLGQTAADADWLIGAGLLKKKGEALRSMKAPGTAYNDPELGGRDPQPDHMSHYRPVDDDNGGVHLYSGIPNRAFYLAAVGIGGKTSEGAGRIWYDAMRSPKLSVDATFADFAQVTVAEAKVHADVVRKSWQTVGVL